MPLKSQSFGVSGTFNVPLDTGMVFVTAAAGGGGGGGTPLATTNGAAGGGAGEACYNVAHRVTPGGTMSFVVGTGGIGSSSNGTAGGDTTFGRIVLRGGKGGQQSAFPRFGGVGGGVGGGSGNVPPYKGATENNTFFGGAGGAAGNAIISAGPAGPYLGGAIGSTDGAREGGAGGGACVYGSGGAGGDGGFVDATIPGHPAPATAYGAGGGGSGATGIQFPFGNHAPKNGGNGARGYILLVWVGA